MLRTFDQLNYRQEQRFHLELGLLKLVHLQRLLPVEQLLSQMPISGRGSAGGGALPGGSSSNKTASLTAGVRASGQTPAPLPLRVVPEHRPIIASVVEPVAPVPFSPFAPVAERKIEPANPPSPIRVPEPAPKVVEVPAAAIAAEPPPVRTPTPLEAASSMPAPMPIQAVSSNNGSAASTIDLEALRDAISGALEAAGHHTAAALLSNGSWTEADGTVRVEVRIKKTMLGLTMNAEAEKIVKSAAREAGVSRSIQVVSAANGSAEEARPAPAKRPPTAGSLQAEALAHPLVKQALELFQGEVRSVLDLREKRNA